MEFGFEEYKADFEQELAAIEHSRTELTTTQKSVVAEIKRSAIIEPIYCYAGIWPWSKRPSAKRLARSCNELLNRLCYSSFGRPSSVDDWVKEEGYYSPEKPALLTTDPNYIGSELSRKLIISVPWELLLCRKRPLRYNSLLGGYYLRICGRFATIPMEYEIVEPEPEYCSPISTHQDIIEAGRELIATGVACGI